MTKTESAYIAAHTQQNDDGSLFNWPAADSSGALPPLGYNAGDLFLGNAGFGTSYTSTDGLTTLTFGASLSGSSFSGSGFDDTAAIPYSGPYCSVDPSTINLKDEAFRDIIPLGDALLFRDAFTKLIPINWYAGDNIAHGAHIATNAISYLHINPAHHSSGHFAGGRIGLGLGGSHPLLYLACNLSPTPDSIFFVTDDGTGDGVFAGRYLIWGPGGISGRLAVGNSLDPSLTVGVNFPTDAIGNYLITFSRVFPALVSSITTVSGSLSPATTYYVRFCFTKSFGGQTIESALSQVIILNSASGYQLNIGTPPEGWTGVRVYYSTSDAQSLDHQNMGTYSSGIYSFTDTASDIISFPSFGFAPWAPGVNIQATGGENLMKIAHLSGQRSTSGLWVFHGYHAGLTPTEAVHHADQSISGGQTISGIGMPDHFTGGALHPLSHMNSFTTKGGSTPEAAHKTTAADGFGGIVFEDPVPAAGSIIDSMVATAAAIDANKLATGSIHPAKLSMNDLLFAPFDITTGLDNTNSSKALTLWTVDTWYKIVATWGPFTVIGPYSQLLAQVTSDATGATGYGDLGPVTYYRGSSGVYTDDPTHPPSGTPPQPLLIAEQADTAELMLTKFTNDYAGTVILHGWARWRGANRPTKISVAMELLGVIV